MSRFHHFFRLFLEDAARWVVQGQVAPIESLTPRMILGMLLRHPPLRAMAWFRLASWCHAAGVRGLPSMLQRRIYFRYGLEIWVGSDVGGGLYIAHPAGTVVAAERIGRNCSVIAAATIGMRNEHRFPVLGDEVFIGAGARVLGGITLGDGAKVGANAVVIRDVAAGATAVGFPARSAARLAPVLADGGVELV